MRGHGDPGQGFSKRGFVGRMAVNMGLKDNSLKVENGTREELTVYHMPLPLPVGGQQLWRTMIVAPGDKLPLLGGEEGSVVTVQVRRLRGFFTPYWHRTLSRQGDYKLVMRPERLSERFWTEAPRLQHEWGVAPQPPSPGVLQRLQEAPLSPLPSARRQRSVSPPGWFRRGGRSKSPPPGRAGSGASSSPLAPPRRQNSGQNLTHPPPAPARTDSPRACPESCDSSSRGTPEDSIDSPPRAPVRQNSGLGARRTSADDSGERGEGGSLNSPAAHGRQHAQSSTIQVLLPVKASSPRPVEAPVRSKSPLARIFGRTASAGSGRGTPAGTPRERGRPPPIGDIGKSSTYDGHQAQSWRESASPPPALKRQDSNRSNGGGGRSPRPKRSLSPIKFLASFRNRDSDKNLNPSLDSPSHASTSQRSSTPPPRTPQTPEDIVDAHLSAHLADMQIDNDVPVRASIALQSAQNVRARGGPPDAPVRSPSGQQLLSSPSNLEAPPYVPSRQRAFQPDAPGSLAPGSGVSRYEDEDPPDTPVRKNFQMGDPVLSPRGFQYFSASHPAEEDEELDFNAPHIPRRTAQLKPDPSDASKERAAPGLLLGLQSSAPLSASVQQVKALHEDEEPASSTLQLTKSEVNHVYAPASATVQDAKTNFDRPNESQPLFMLQGRLPVVPGMHAPVPAAHPIPSSSASSTLSTPKGILSPRGVLRHTSSFGSETERESDGGARRSAPSTPMNGGTPKGIKWAVNLHESYENTPRNSFDASAEDSDFGRHRTGIPPRSSKRLKDDVLDNILSEHEDGMASNKAMSEGSLNQKGDNCPVCGLMVWAGQPRFTSTEGRNYHPECTKNSGGPLHGQFRS